MLLAVMKMEGHIPGGGFHYSLMPEVIIPPKDAIYRQMGMVIIDVSPSVGNQLLESARLALMHQMDIAIRAEQALKTEKEKRSITAYDGSLERVRAQRTWDNQFDPQVHTIPPAILQLVENKAAEDMSWSNDVCPSFGCELPHDATLRIWVDHIDPKQREHPSMHRFAVDIYSSDERNGTKLDTDNVWQAIAEYYRQKKVALEQKTILFTEFQATGRDHEDISVIVEGWPFISGGDPTPGRLYHGNLWMQDAQVWTKAAPGYGKGRWYSMIGSIEYQSDDREEIELELYKYALSERLFD